MSISSRGSCRSTVSIMRAMFSRSLYVGTMTRTRAFSSEPSIVGGGEVRCMPIRSGGRDGRLEPAAVRDEPDNEQDCCHNHGGQRHRLPFAVTRIGEGHIDVLRTGRKADTDQVVV